MSDDEDFDMVEEEDEEDEEEEEEDGPENKYYTAKSLSVNEALEEFTQLSLLNNDWSFKSLKQAAKLSFKSSLFQKAVDFYTKLILLIPRLSLQKNYIEKSINNYLDLVSSSDNVDFLVEIYKVTLASLDQNDRLFHKTHLKLAKLWLDKKNYSRLLESTSLLHNSCNSADGSLDAKKGTLLLEVYALEIQMYTETNDTKRLKEIYNKCINVTSAISHPKIMAVIRECGGKMHMQQCIST